MINFSAGVTSLVVVLIFVVVKFTEGAWLVVILFAIGVPALIRLNREYRVESPGAGRHRRPAQAAGAAEVHPAHGLRLGGQLGPGHHRCAALRAQPAADHAARGPFRDRQPAQAEQLREEWSRTDRGVVLDFFDCPDRRVARRAAELASDEAGQPGTPRHRGAAAAQLRTVARPAAARPHRGQDRRRGQPDPERDGHHRPVRRAQPDRGAARAPARRPGGQAGRRGHRERRGRGPASPVGSRPAAAAAGQPAGRGPGRASRRAPAAAGPGPRRGTAAATGRRDRGTRPPTCPR